MNKLQIATAAVESATAAILAKQRTLRRHFYREAVKAIHLGSVNATERDLQNALIPVIRGHVEEMVRKLGGAKSTKSISPTKLVRRITDTEKWRDDLVNACLPVLAIRMAEAARNQLTQLGSRRRRMRRKKIESNPTKSTATEWLERNPDNLERLEELLDGMGLPVSILTELPTSMKRKIVQLLQESFRQDYWQDIAETTAGDAERILEEGLQEGYSIRRMADEMMDQLGGDRYAMYRATNIARTESGNALNGARKGVVDQLAEDVPEAKIRAEWLSVLGTTTRPAHADLDGVPADENGLWDLNGVKIPWPGHFSLPGGDRCQCQCSIVTAFGMDEDAAARLISDYEDRVEEEE